MVQGGEFAGRTGLASLDSVASPRLDDAMCVNTWLPVTPEYSAIVAPQFESPSIAWFTAAVRPGWISFAPTGLRHCAIKAPDDSRHDRSEPGVTASGRVTTVSTDRNVLIMPKLKTHKGMKKRFKVSATGKVSHKRCGSSHLKSHKSGKQVRRLRKKSFLDVSAESKRVRSPCTIARTSTRLMWKPPNRQLWPRRPADTPAPAKPTPGSDE